MTDLVPTDGDTAELEREAEWLEVKLAIRERILAHGYDPDVCKVLDDLMGFGAHIDQRMRLVAQCNELRAAIKDIRAIIDEAHADCDMNPCKHCLERARFKAENRREDGQ